MLANKIPKNLITVTAGILLLVICSAWYSSAYGNNTYSGISENVKTALYEKGIQAAVSEIDKIENPSGEEVFLAIYLISEFFAASEKAETYQENVSYKASTSYKLNYYLNNLIKLGNNEVIDLDNLSKTNFLAKNIKYFRKMMLIDKPESLILFFKELPSGLMSDSNQGIDYFVFSNVFLSFYQISNKSYSDLCRGLYYASPSSLIADVLLNLGDKRCNNGKSKLFSLVVPLNSNPEKIKNLNDIELDNLFNYWKSNYSIAISRWDRYFLPSECNAYTSKNKRERQVCFLISPESASKCSLEFWNELNHPASSGEFGKTDTWVGSKGFKDCRLKYISRVIGR